MSNFVRDIEVSKVLLTELVKLAEIANDNDSDGVSFDIGSADGYTLSADITFRITKESKQ